MQQHDKHDRLDGMRNLNLKHTMHLPCCSPNHLDVSKQCKMKTHLLMHWPDRQLFSRFPSRFLFLPRRSTVFSLPTSLKSTITWCVIKCDSIQQMTAPSSITGHSLSIAINCLIFSSEWRLDIFCSVLGRFCALHTRTMQLSSFLSLYRWVQLHLPRTYKIQSATAMN